jgi:hypothetical protein
MEQRSGGKYLYARQSGTHKRGKDIREGQWILVLRNQGRGPLFCLRREAQVGGWKQTIWMESVKALVREKKYYLQWNLKIFKKNLGKGLFYMDGQERMLDDNNLPRLWVCQQGTGRMMLRQKGGKQYALTHGRRL